MPPELPAVRNRLHVATSPFVVVIGHDPKADRDWVEIADDTGRVAPDTALYERFPQYYQKYNGSVRDLIIEAAPRVRYGNVVKVMDAACQAGFSEFGLANSALGATRHVFPPPGFQKELPGCRRAVKGEVLEGPGPRPPHQHVILVEITSTNDVWINKHRTTSARLYEDLSRAVHHFGNDDAGLPHLSLVADADASWQTIITVLDAARQAGDDDVGFVTQ